MRLDIATIASLILSALVADDAMTARELAVVTGLSTAQLRPALRLLRDREDVVTSGRGAGTRYVLAVEEQLEAVRRPRSPRRLRPVIPATVDVLGALERTAAALADGATLPELSARPAPPIDRVVIAELAAEVGTLLPPPPAPLLPGPVLRRECSTPAEDVVAGQLARRQAEAAGDAHDRATERRERVQHAVMALVSVLMILAPVAWVVARLVP